MYLRFKILPLSFLVLLTSAHPTTPPLRDTPESDLPQSTRYSRLEEAVSTLQRVFYNSVKGTYPTSINWTCAVISTIFASTLPQHSSPEISLFTISRLFLSQPTQHLHQEAYDDMLWVALQWSESYRIQGQYPRSPTSRLLSAYLARSKEFWNAGGEGWDEKLCGGGMIWAPQLEPYKNAITNELWISASAGLARLAEQGSQERAELIRRAAAGWDWLHASNMRDHEGLFVDGFHISKLKDDVPDSEKVCDARSEAVYTYNQGTILPGLKDLAILTGNETYLDIAHDLVAKTILRPSRLNQMGYLTERCDPYAKCSQNGQMFKGIWAAALARLCEGAEGIWKGKCSRYKNFVRRNAEAVWNTRDAEGRFGCWWGAGRQRVEHLWDGERWESFPESRGRSWEGEQIGYDTSALETVINGGDENDRGRGRTVECMASGVAMLAADLVFSSL